MEKPKKVVLIGFDAPIVKSIWRYAKEGSMPTIEKLIENGVWVENCLVPHPTITPPNWTTIVTGSWPGTHGITCFNLHKSGMPLNQTYQAFFSTDCQSEYIWNAIEKNGKKTILFNYPSTWPPTVNNGIQIAGAGLSMNEWRINSRNPQFDVSVNADLLFTTRELPQASSIKMEKASEWKNLKLNENDLEAELKITQRMAREDFEPKTFWLLIKPAKGEVLLASSKDSKGILAELKVGQWSGKIVDEFKTASGIKKAVFRCKLLFLSPDGKEINFYFTPICQLDGWSKPENIAKELEDMEGLPIPCSFYVSFHLDWFDVETLTEMIEMQNQWYGESLNKLLTKNEWDLLVMHAHCPDHAYHAYINNLEPMVQKDKKKLERFLNAERRFYSSLDKMVSRILEAADEETLVMITSDHGAVPTEGRYDEGFKGFDVGGILTKAGLISWKDNSRTGKKEVDWTKTKAITQRSVYVYVNLKGRDPDGIVEPGEEYEKLCDQIINLLYDYTDSKTGKKPIAFALKKEDARILGLYGDRVGDIVYGVHGWVSGEHGRQLTTSDYGMGSLKGLLIMKGPGIKKGEILKRNVWLVDIVPTICYLMDWPVPGNAEGSIIYQAFEDPDFKSKEIGSLRKNYERVKSALEGQKALTHSYGEF